MTHRHPISRPALLAAALLAALCAAILPLQAQDQKKAGNGKPALTITTVRPATAELPIAIEANGSIAAWQEAIIGSESNGLRLAEVLVNVGDQVKAGQVLARFAGETVAADVAQSRASLLEAQANAADAVANAERALTLRDTGAMSVQQINQYQTAAQVAKARVEAAKATLAAQQLRQKFLQVVAPDAGVISARAATVGAVVPAGTELFRLIRRGRLEWRAEVIATELGRISAGVPVILTLPDNSEIRGQVRQIGPTLDPQRRTALVYVDLPAQQGKQSSARAGMFARGRFEIGKSSALTVPQQAVVLRDGFSYVYEVTPDSRVRQVKIEVGRRLGDRVEVLKGLRQDALLVASGAGFLNDGDVVKVVNAPPAQASANAASQGK
ncbi:efflux RND transporter periplasmic adaptor subunit [Noviherbaspirillum galbum]|uniref:Efflux RND transporter periplasmic adaptor subunit n=1 Tax=Noviherbaspirillum galbum TaxID=2709383 RepID=A0A6B3SF41_9BURK|nr:efflux RND transporter periplasmic adaptor subunit [Noviherbaspirillum galbum]NEX59517.1 efflux RND transporter periplasmic adaptor subunit [Noviherbaspirillum galbum]